MNKTNESKSPGLVSILFMKGDAVVLRVSCLAEFELRKFRDSVIDDDVDDRNWELNEKKSGQRRRFDFLEISQLV